MAALFTGKVKVSFFFLDGNNYGWSENFYYEGEDNAAIAAAKLMLPTRLALLGTDCRIAYIRASDIGVRGDSQIYVPSIREGTGTAADGLSDIANTDLVIRVEALASFTIRRVIYMRGQPDLECSQGGFYTPSPGFIRAFNQWDKAMGVNNFQIYASAFSNDVNITGVTQAANGQITLALAGPCPQTYPGQINVFGVRKNPALRGRHSIAFAPVGNSVTFNSTHFVRPFLGGGVVQAVSPTLAIWGSSQVIRCSHRISGRPFDSPRGRQLASSR